MGLYVAPMTFNWIMLSAAWWVSTCTSLLLILRARNSDREVARLRAANAELVKQRDYSAIKRAEAERSLDAGNKARLDAQLDALHGERRL